MKFSTKEDIEAPLDHVFQHVCDFAGFERALVVRGAEISRVLDPVQAGTTWNAGFQFRGKKRTAEAKLSWIDPERGYEIGFESGGITGNSVLELVPLAPSRTRLMVELNLSPKTLAARLLLQSVRLSKNNLTHRFKTRIAHFAEDVEVAYRR